MSYLTIDLNYSKLLLKVKYYLIKYSLKTNTCIMLISISPTFKQK